MTDQLDIVREFLVESYENLDQLDRDLLALEQDPASQPTLSSVFRTIHTIKGTCGFLGFGKLESVTHAGESLLSKLRDGSLALRPEISTGLFGLVDAVREMLRNIETAGVEGETDHAELIQTLVRLQEAELADNEAGATATQAESVDAPNAADKDDAPASSAEVSHEPGGNPEDAKPPGPACDSTIRVDVGLLDKLMNHVGELVLARNQILQYSGACRDAALVNTSQRLSAITTELQEGVMKTRLQPIGNVWNKFPRVVRDLAVQCGKRVRIEMMGKETELDKTIVEAIKDPLTHLVRNAVDHGIEPPELRMAAGKPAEGRLRLWAFHEGGQVNIEIADDGGGLNIDRIREEALQRKLISPEEARRMSDRDIAQLILAPGFSTAAKVTNVSGRGVGMDVVKTNVEKIGGTLEIQSQPGLGTTVRLKIPLTLAIIPALIVTCGGERFAIPQVSLLELVRLTENGAKQRIESIHGAPVFRLRGQLLPIVELRRELKLDAGVSAANAAPAEARDWVHIVVLKADGRQFGLVVDSVNDTEEIVVKPLTSQLKRISVYAGATIMGDGRVALILDVLGMAQRAAVVTGDRNSTRSQSMEQTCQEAGECQILLLLTAGKRRLGLPISQVARLEAVQPTQIETADGREVIQYRGDILPLLRLDELLGLPPGESGAEAPRRVVVCRCGQTSVGLVVDQIADIVEVTAQVRREARTAGLLASLVIQEQVTDLVDLAAVMRLAGLPADPLAAETAL